ncbi:MAG: HAMP domain-containing sensor histidine kinase [Candidatus Moranbacteria bacterium]|jgi:signal transduction histidine kinase|nr:HAMP domain-containing sensor histidine kinase [Candidatus Moranbacteria bacterium]
MSWLVNDLNIKKQAEGLGVSVWQTPSFMFIFLGFVIVFVMTAVFFVSRDFVTAEFLVVAESVVVIFILIVGNIVIKNMEKLAQLNKMKSEFVSIISHQLKTPLTEISWDIELFVDKYSEGLNKKQREILSSMETSNALMSRMVRDLLDVARIDQNNFFTRKDEIDIVDLVRVVVEKNKALTSKNKVSIDLLVDDNMPKIIGDEKRMEVVLDNFVSNAVKYNKEGGKVKVKVGRDNGKALISVKDTGIGIPKNEQDRVFNKFYRSKEASSKETGGTGLGLYIAKNIIEKSGGKVWFHSEEGEGSEFHFSLPIV